MCERLPESKSIRDHFRHLHRAGTRVRGYGPRPGACMTSPLGEFIRRQRELQELSMRQLADLVGISNPYLSQIERGLREPSEKVLDAIAENLQLSGDALTSTAAAGGRTPA